MGAMRFELFRALEERDGAPASAVARVMSASFWRSPALRVPSRVSVIGLAKEENHVRAQELPEHRGVRT